MNLRNNLTALAAAAFSATAAMADTGVTASKVVVSTDDKGSAEMTLIGTTPGGCQVWSSTVGDQANGTKTVWKIDDTSLSANEGYFYPGTYTLTANYTDSYNRKLPAQADLYQFLTIQGATSANLYIPTSVKPKNDEGLLIKPAVSLSPSTNYTFDDGSQQLTQTVTYTATGIADAAVDHAVLKYSYNGGLSWDSITSTAAAAQYTFSVKHKYSEDKVRYRFTLYPKSQYLPALDNTQWEASETDDIDISCENRVKYKASTVTMSFSAVQDKQSYSYIGLTGQGYQMWATKVTVNNTNSTLWAIDGTSIKGYYSEAGWADSKYVANHVYGLGSDGAVTGTQSVQNTSDYTHFVRVNSKDKAHYFSWKYNDTFSPLPTDFYVAAKCSVESAGDYTPNTADDNLSHTVTCTVRNANSLMLDGVTVQYSCDGGATWSAGQEVSGFTASSTDECASTCTATFTDIPASATKIRYRATVHTKNDYKIVCQDFSWTSTDLDVTVADDKLTDVLVYKRVMSADELVAGDSYLIVNAASGKALGFQNTDKTRKAEDVTFSGNKVKIAENRIATSKSTATDKTVTEFTLGGETGSWTFKDNALKGSYYLCASGSGSETYYYLTTMTSSLSDNSWKAAVTLSETGDATITFGGEATANTIGYNNSTHIFTCYPATSTSANVQTVQLYRKVSAFNISDAGYCTYYTDFAYTMPSGATGYTVTRKDDNSLSLNALYPEKSVVPARTPLLIKGSGAYTCLAASCTDAAPTDNLLHGSIVKEQTNVPGATHYYKLSLGTDGKAGFYWGAADGAAFDNAAGKAYLALTNTTAGSPQRGFALDPDGSVTGIASAVEAHAAAAPAIYDLNGRRLSTLQGVQKGVYIVNGKKVMVK